MDSGGEYLNTVDVDARAAVIVVENDAIGAGSNAITGRRTVSECTWRAVTACSAVKLRYWCGHVFTCASGHFSDRDTNAVADFAHWAQTHHHALMCR